MSAKEKVQPPPMVVPIERATAETSSSSKKISSKFAMVNLVKGMWGAGCFAMPLAFKQAGWAVGLGIIVFMGALTTISMLRLVKCANHLTRRKKVESLDYGELGFEATESSWESLRAWASTSKVAVNVALISLQMGICCVCYIFVVYHTHEVLRVVMNDVPSRSALFPMLLPVFLALGCVTSIHVLSAVSLIGNVLMTMSIFIILFQLIWSDHKGLSELPPVTTFAGMITAAGSIVYSLEGQALVLPLKNRMKRPEDMSGFFGVLNAGVCTVSMAYASVGFFGFLTFGGQVEDSITLNMPNDVVGVFVKASLLVSVCTGFSIQVFPIVTMVWPSVKARLAQKGIVGFKCTALQVVFRLCIVLVAFTASVLIPRLQDMMPLIGVTSTMMLAFVFPGLFHLLLFGPQGPGEVSQARHCVELAFDVFLIALGLFFLVVGVATNVHNLLTPH